MAHTIKSQVTSVPETLEKTIETIEEPIETEVVVPKYTEDELYCLAAIIYNEAGSNSCSDEMREMVGYVVLNRVNDPRFPNTIKEVVEQPGQYAGMWQNGVHYSPRYKNPGETEAVKRARNIAIKVLENRDNIPIPANVLFQAQFIQGIGVYRKIGNTYFCYAKEIK